MGMAIFRKTKTLLAVACVILAVAVVPVVTRRPTRTDPNEISKLPPNELRDAEIECLIRAAFRKATAVAIQSEAAPSITINDPQVLNDLAKQFAVGFDAEPLPMYRHPGLEYTRLTFEGPYAPPLFVFTSEKGALLSGDEPKGYRRFYVRNQFCLALAELLALKLDGQLGDRPRPGGLENRRPFDDIPAERYDRREGSD